MNDLSENLPLRAGQAILQPTGYRALLPKPLPPEPPLAMDHEMIHWLSKADLALGRLDGLASIIADPDVFVYLYVRKEALLSSQIEGTQCSLEDILTERDRASTSDLDVQEVSNYVAAMNQGLARLKDLPVSTRLIKEIHAMLLEGVRGTDKTPGEFRTSQNWIGRPGATLENAEFIPPPPAEVGRRMSDLENFIHQADALPALVKVALVHAQFETIHPFLDGNGRLGRLLITFLLCSWGVLEKPLLYLSYFFKAHRTEYYNRLMAVRGKGDWEGWVKFFLRGVTETAELANTTARAIHQIHRRDRARIQQQRHTAMMVRVFEQLCRYPVLTLPQMLRLLGGAAVPTVQRAMDKLQALGMVSEVSGQQRNRRYAYPEYLELLLKDTITPMG